MNQQLPAGFNIASARLPAAYESAKRALESCASVDECKDWADKAAALASYARQSEDLELEKLARRIRDRALRRAGELLKQVDARPQNASKQKEVTRLLISQRALANQAGMSEWQAKNAVRIANIPPEDFERQVESDNPPSVSDLARQGTKARQPPDPQSWLKGRDPQAFNKVMHFVGDVETYADDIGKADLQTILSNLDDRDREKLRLAISRIDQIHDTIVTRI